MSKIISVVHRDAAGAADAERKLAHILAAITPDLLAGRARCAVRRAGNHVQGSLNLPDHFPRRGLSLCQGKLYDTGEPTPWWLPGSGCPDGSYALLREDAASFEAVADPAGSRALWYYFDDAVFVVSNSQRAVTLYAGRFAFNPGIVPWMLSTGSPGPDNSYNRHLRLVPPAGTVLLDKARWRIQPTAPEIRFDARQDSDAAHMAALEAALAATFAAFDARDAAHSTLSLSGGCDSRAVAALLRMAAPDARWPSFTGGPAGAQDIPGTDAAIAAELAHRTGAAHRFIANGESPEPIETLVRRFVLNGEGRIDHLAGYLDGMALFAALFDAGVAVLLRGAQGFGMKSTAPSELAVRQSMEMLLCGDIANLAPHARAFGLDEHRLPPALERRPEESLAAWRDRLYHAFRIPLVLTALTEIKTGFVDVVNPLLSRRTLEVARALPDHLRTDKALFRALVRRLGPDLPFARDRAGPNRLEVLRRPGMRALLAASLDSATAQTCFGAPLTAWLRREIALTDRLPVRALRAGRAWVSRRVSRRLPGGRAPDPRPVVHPLRLAFRVHMAVTMVNQLTADAAEFGPAERAPAAARPGLDRAR